MRVIVGGAGQTGMHLVEFLLAEGTDVVVLDSSAERIRHINDKYEVQAIVGHVSDPETLRAAGASPETDIFISVAQSDEVNIVATQVAYWTFGIQTNIARIRRSSYQSDDFQKIFSNSSPISHIIWPERETADAIHTSLSVPGAVEAISLCDNTVEVISLQLDESCPILNISLRDLTQRFSDLPITIMAILRQEKIIVPSAGETLQNRDQIYICTDSQYVRQSMETFGVKPQKINNILIAGGGQISTELALKLAEADHDLRIRIIEKDSQRAREISQIMQGRAIVLRGDAMDMEILEEAGLDRVDCVLSLTNHEETNILLSLLAKRQSECLVGVLVNQSDYFPLLKALGINMVISPREITASSILRYMRLGHVHQAHAIAGGLAEIIESEITQSSPVYGKTIGESRFPKDTIVGAIMRDNQMLVPKPNMHIQEGDHLVVLAKRAKARKLQDKLSSLTYS